MNYLGLLWKLFLMKNNLKKPADKIQSLQSKNLRKILNYAYDNSEYYHRTFTQKGITKANIDSAPLSAFPTTDKSVLIEHFDEIITAKDISQKDLRRFDAEETIDKKKLKGKYHVVHSSGSTAEPGYFLYDDDAWQSMLIGIIRAALWNMSMKDILKFLKGRPHIAYIAATDGRYGGAMAVGDGIDGVGAKQLFLDIKTSLSEWIEKINDFKPDMIVGYPSAIKILGELAEKSAVDIDVMRIVSCGEPLGNTMRRYLERVFKTEVFNFYGASESLALGIEDGRLDGMYLFDDLNYIEVENGAMYLTSLYNFVQPLIRYKISDRLILTPPLKNNRFPFTPARGLVGRNEDLMWFDDLNGGREFVHPLAVEGFCVEGVVDYQFCQTSASSFEMIIEPTDGADKDRIKAEMLRNMEQILADKKLTHVRFYVRFVNKIEAYKNTGKKSLIRKENVI